MTIPKGMHDWTSSGTSSLLLWHIFAAHMQSTHAENPLPGKDIAAMSLISMTNLLQGLQP